MRRCTASFLKQKRSFMSYFDRGMFTQLVHFHIYRSVALNFKDEFRSLPYACLGTGVKLEHQ
jgi:hypothetical protein